MSREFKDKKINTSINTSIYFSELRIFFSRLRANYSGLLSALVFFNSRLTASYSRLSRCELQRSFPLLLRVYLL